MVKDKQPTSSRASAELQALIDVLAEISGSLNLEESMPRIMQAVADAMNAEAASLLMLDRSTSNLHFKAAVGDKAEEITTLSLGPGEGIVGWVAQNGQPLLVKDASDDPRHRRDVAESLNFPCKSVVAVPIFDGEKVIGAVEVMNPIGNQPFDEQSIEYLTALSRLLSIAILNAKAYAALRDEVTELRSALEVRRTIIGQHPSIQEALDLVRKTSPFDVTVLITGESGTGKELIARALHELSPRAKGPFVAVNCTAMPDTLLESELFGHEKGAFTDAAKLRKGKFELASGGTLFLDEVGDMSDAAQAKVLRAIEERKFERVGGMEPIEVDVRIVAATNKDLAEMIKNGKFRQDLFYRLNELPISLPPLRQRGEDIPLLAEHFIQEFSEQFGKKVKELDERARQLMLQYDWPGNIRELRNVIKGAIILSDSDTITAQHLPMHIRQASALAKGAAEPEGSLQAAEHIQILTVLEETGWNKSQAAKTLGISRPTLDAKIKKYNIQKEE
ncbi:MAG: GAF domain-containing protein [Planctomycetes bacterium]|nr:GAF domain-containing protein [Planctomycetota bacterium]